MTKPIVLLYHSDAAFHGTTDCQVAIEDRTSLKFYPTGLPSFSIGLAELKLAIRMLETQEATDGQNRLA